MVAPTPKIAAMPAVIKKAEVTVTVTPILNESPTVEAALRIISEESGVAVADLTDDCIFADIGVDSLLSLVITSRFREELDLDMELDEMFTNYPGVMDLKEFLAPAGKKSSTATSSVVADIDILSLVPSKEPVVQVLEIGVDADFEAALAIVSEESGVAVTDLTDDCVFSDIGLDSLLSLVIVSRFREELDLDIDLEDIFVDYPTVKHLKGLFTGGRSEDTTRIQSISPDSLDEGTPIDSSPATSRDSGSEHDLSLKPTLIPVPAATSVILQGNAKNSQRTLFLFPDGSGSATSYSGIPRVDPQVAVIGLNSPYYRNPEAFRCTIDDLIESYITELRRRQPQGPYHLGGWSAGGILAYRAAQSFISSNETVQNLILIDSPVPTHGLDRLPQHFYDFCNKVHLFGEKATSTTSGPTSNPPEWLVPHFNATIDTLHEYRAQPLPHGKAPKTSLIWACDSVIDGKTVPKLPPHVDDTEGMKFLTEPRTDFSSNGWEVLFPGGQVRVERAVGANHFSMMVSSLTLFSLPLGGFCFCHGMLHFANLVFVCAAC